MQQESLIQNPATKSDSALHYRGAIWSLLILAPVISEVLSGSTRLSILFVLIPEVMVWGCGALLCRELVRRWRGGATSLLMLGLALSIAEEFIIQQTSIAPLPFPGSNASYGRYAGVNWLYFLFMLGFESVAVVLVPVQVTELFFPNRRKHPWLRKRGIIATCIAFLIGSRIAWYGWTQQARPRLNASPYHPPMVLILIGLTAIVALVLMAWLLRKHGHSSRAESRRPLHPGFIGLIAFLLSGPWFWLITLLFVPHPGLAVWIPVSAGIVWALLSYSLLRYLTAAHAWRDIHRWALSFGAVLGFMVPGDMSAAGWTRVDLIGKFAFQLLAVVGFLLLARKVRRHEYADPIANELDLPRA
jgi:hypothetical protein